MWSKKTLGKDSKISRRGGWREGEERGGEEGRKEGVPNEEDPSQCGEWA